MLGENESNSDYSSQSANASAIRKSSSGESISVLSAKPAPLISRDEMNLAEFPLTVLSTRSDSKIKTLEFSDTIYNKNGSPTHRKWIITGADKFGLPTASDEEILLGLLKLTVDSGFTERKVFFTRYELLRILRWTTEGRSYTRLQNALDRLSGVRIKASNAFFDNESKAHSTRNFGIIDAYEINDGRDSNPKPSFFTWSEVLFKSFQAGFIKKLDLEYYLDLSSAVSRRLYRYLDKHFWYKGLIKINLFTLAHEKIGISRNYRFPSSLRQQLDPAFEELISKGFIESVQYVGKGSATEVCIAARAGKKALSETSAEQGAPSGQKSTSTKPQAKTTEHYGQQGRGESSKEKPRASHILQLLLDRGIQAKVAERLLNDREDAALTRIERIIRYVDDLSAQNSRLVSRNPQGFLYRAVEKPELFRLPDDPKEVFEKSEPKRKEVARGQGTAARKSEDRQAEYLVYRKRELQRLREEAEPKLLNELGGKIRLALKNISGLISAEKFEMAVEHAVDEKLAKLFAVPNFEEWSK